MRRTVLIADDKASARNILQKILEPEGYDVIEAESGEQAIALANTMQIDAFIIDLDMPRINGVAVCRAVRAMEQYRGSPVIFSTGSTDDAALEAAFEAGGDDFINQPYAFAAVRARLRAHLQRAEYSHRL